MDALGLIPFIEASGLRDGGTISFHHHLRDGDRIIETALSACRTLGLTDLHLAPSSLFPCHAGLVPFLQDGTVSRITTAYITGPLADFISAGGLAKPVRLTTHGGRARMLPTEAPGLAVMAAPAVDAQGNLGGADGPWACGPLGYAMVDAACARYVLAVTPHRVDRLSRQCIPAQQVDAIADVSTIGDASQIESGTTARQIGPDAKVMAAQAVEVVRLSGLLCDGFTFQTGAGGVSLAVAQSLGPVMAQAAITGAFTAGGITSAHVEMVRAGLFQRIKDVQAFDLAAVESYRHDAFHDGISADEYANPQRSNCIAHQLDVMILGAAEVDIDFNVNVTTTGTGRIIGGSGGHADTAEGAKLAIVVVPHQTKGVARVVERVQCVTTPGTSIDVVVTDKGIAVNPARPDLAKALRRGGLTLCHIQDLAQPTQQAGRSGRIIAEIEDRHGGVQDRLYQIST